MPTNAPTQTAPDAQEGGWREETIGPTRRWVKMDWRIHETTMNDFVCADADGWRRGSHQTLEDAKASFPPAPASPATPDAETVEALLRDGIPSCESYGHPEPAKRFARVVIEFRGEDYIERSQALYAALATSPRPRTGGAADV